jgi:hypothetical protein
MNTTTAPRARVNGAASHFHQAPGGALIDTRLHRATQVLRAPLTDDEHADRLAHDAAVQRLARLRAHSRNDARLFLLLVIVAIGVLIDLVQPWLPGAAP